MSSFIVESVNFTYLIFSIDTYIYFDFFQLFLICIQIFIDM